MEATDWVLAYAAVVSTAVAVFQIATGLRRRKTIVRVNLFRIPPEGEEWFWLTIEVINRSEHAIRIDSVGLQKPDGSERMVLGSTPHLIELEPLYERLEPHDGRLGMIWRAGFDSLGEFPPAEPVVAFVTTSDGNRFASKPIVPNLPSG